MSNRSEFLEKELHPLLQEAVAKCKERGCALVVAIWDSETNAVSSVEYDGAAFKPHTPLLSIIAHLWSLLLHQGNAPVNKELGEILQDSIHGNPGLI